MPETLTQERRSIKVGTRVKVIRFKTPSRFDIPKYAEDERDFIAGFVGKFGIVESEDGDIRHPYAVFFGENAAQRRCRFSAAELRIA